MRYSLTLIDFHVLLCSTVLQFELGSALKIQFDSTHKILVNQFLVLVYLSAIQLTMLCLQFLHRNFFFLKLL